MPCRSLLSTSFHASIPLSQQGSLASPRLCGSPGTWPFSQPTSCPLGYIHHMAVRTRTLTASEARGPQVRLIEPTTHGWYHKVRTVGHTADLLVSAAASHYSVCGSQLCRPAVYFIQEHSFIQLCLLFRLLPRSMPGCAQADAAAHAVISACTVSVCTTR